MFTNLIYFVITFIIPVKRTYQSLASEEQNKQAATIWSIYWSIFAFISLLTCFLPFLKIQTFSIVIMLFLLWLYHDEFRGALYLKQNLVSLCSQVDLIKSILQSIKQLNLTLRILDSDQNVKED